VLYASAVPVVAQYGDALAGKVIFDSTNPFNAAGDGLTTRDGSSIAQEVANAAPGSGSVVEAFNTIFRDVLARVRPLDVFIAGDNVHAKVGVEGLIESLGLRPMDVGGLKWRCGWKERAWSCWAPPGTPSEISTSPSASPFPAEARHPRTNDDWT
jgi:predicted dinucleotide-binding enzyme